MCAVARGDDGPAVSMRALPGAGCRLPVNTEIIQIQSGRSFGEDIALGRIVAELVVEPEANALHEEIGIEPLRAGRKRRAAAAKRNMDACEDGIPAA